MKRILYPLLIFVLVASSVWGVFGNVTTVDAQNIERSSEDTGSNPTSPTINGPAASNASQEEIEANNAEDVAASGGSGNFLSLGWGVEFILGVFGKFIAIFIWIFSWFLFWAGLFFDTAVHFTITSGAFRAENVALISVGWPVVRDFSSLFIVLSMLVIAIATMLRIESYSYKTALPRLILVALLISFSLPVGQFIIDASNVLAVGIYNDIAAPARNDTGVTLATSIFGVSVGNATAISEVFAQGLYITDVHMIKSNDTLGNIAGGLTGGVAILTSGIMGIIVLLVTSFIFVAFGMLFVTRTVVLWILLVFSPAAFAGMIFPSTSQYSSKWWKTLFSQSFFAPISLFMIWLVAKFIGSGFVQKTIDHTVGVGQESFYNGFSSNMQVVMQYIILIVLLWKSLELAQQLGAHGAEAFVKKGIEWKGSAKDAAKRYGQGRAGRVLDRALDSQGATGRATRALLNNRVSSTLGITRGVLSASNKGKEAREYTATQEAGLLKDLSPREQARMLRSMSGAGALRAFDKMDNEAKTKVAEHLNDVNNPAALQNFANTIRTAAEKDKSGNIKTAKVMEGVARAALPHVADATDALKIMNPALFAAGAPAFAPGTPEHAEASSAIATLMNGMKSDQRADVFTRDGKQDNNVGKFMREYFAQNGNIADVTKSQKSLNAGNEMLIKTLQEKGIDLFDAHAIATSEAQRKLDEKNRKRLARGMTALSLEEEDVNKEYRAELAKAAARTGDRNLSEQISKQMFSVLMNPRGVAVRNPS